MDKKFFIQVSIFVGCFVCLVLGIIFYSHLVVADELFLDEERVLEIPQESVVFFTDSYGSMKYATSTSYTVDEKKVLIEQANNTKSITDILSKIELLLIKIEKNTR